ncbi:MAG: hypothetical protein NC826_02570 [Candidatus Omnitrophica bacterium]|nr:hypothetical protein [Candidatus Omnitrophota bacterium]
MRLEINFKIIHKNIGIITNSFILKDLIQDGLALSNLHYKKKNKETIKFILKASHGYVEAFDAFLKLINKILTAAYNDYFIFHGSAFSFNGKGILVLGKSGSGKSSTCFFAGLFGAKILSDEPVIIERKTSKVIPFRYLIKISNFNKNFSRYNFFIKHNFNQIVNHRNNYHILKKGDLKNLGIELEYQPVPLKKIIFLETKKYDNLIHLIKHYILPKKELLKSLNNFIKEKEIVFVPHIISDIKHKKKTKNLLRILR